MDLNVVFVGISSDDKSANKLVAFNPSPRSPKPPIEEEPLITLRPSAKAASPTLTGSSGDTADTSTI